MKLLLEKHNNFSFGPEMMGLPGLALLICGSRYRVGSLGDMMVGITWVAGGIKPLIMKLEG